MFGTTVSIIFLIAWIYSYFLLMDSGKIYYQIFAVFMTGLFGALVLEISRWSYRKIRGIFRGSKA